MYQIINTLNGGQCVKRLTDNVFIPFAPDNQDFVQYQKWLSEGNTPIPADESNA